MGNEVDPSWMLLGAKAIISQMEALVKESEGVITQRDVENVHRMRVASRRVRAALDTFEDCLPEKLGGTWRKEIKRITRMLGEARDTDVQIEFLKDILPSTGPQQRPGIEFVLDLKVKQRASLQPPLVDSLRALEGRGRLAEMVAFFRKEEERATEAGVPERSPEAFEKAWERVHVRVEEILEHEEYVHQEDAMAEHHAMRISAKRLRYALELVSPLFDDALREEISRIKKLQEVLGELHDCDVWVQDLGRLLDSMEKGDKKPMSLASAQKVRTGISFLRQERSRKRKEAYKEFAGLWDSLADEGFLFTLLRRLEASADQTPDLTSRAIESLLKDPGTKVAVVGDVHGNLQALKAVLQDAERRGAKVILNTGDLLGYGANPEECIRLLRSLPSMSVIGNYDLKVFRIHDRVELWPEGKSKAKMLAFKWAYDHITPASRTWLRSLPKEVRMEVGGARLLMVHGSPDSMDEHLGPETPDNRLEDIAGSAGADLIIMGHSHRAMSRSVKGVRFLNPGSVGRQDDGDPRASYALLRIKPYRASLHRVGYDVKGAVRAIREAGLPKEFAKMIQEGRAYDQVAGKGKEPALDRETAIALAWKVAHSYLGEDPHTAQVTRLSMILFDCLSPRMKLGKEDRFWLECAAILHDIGWSEGRAGHHKTSLRMILEEEALPFDRNERRAIGSIARYHRKSMPDRRDAHFANLGTKDRRRVMGLAAILRIADSLDGSHSAKVKTLRCQIDSDRLILHCGTTASLEMEEREARKKGDLLRYVTGLEVELRKELD